MNKHRVPSWVLALDSRGGPFTAAAADFASWQGLVEDFPRGHGAVAALASMIDAWSQRDPHEQDDQRFIDGVGAWLGLVLMDALGGEHRARDKRHRVRVGRFGFVDPFAMVDAALHADSPRRELAAQLSRAEAEGAGTGALSRVVAALEQALEGKAHLPFADHFECDVRLASGIEIDLKRTVAATEDQGMNAVETAVRKLVSMLPGETLASGDAWDDVAARLVPRLISRAFLSELTRRTQAAQSLHSTPVSSEVEIAYLVRDNDRARYVRQNELSGWGVSAMEVHRRAIENLARNSERARFGEVHTTEGSMVVARSGDGLDAARLLLPTLHDVLAPVLGSPFVVAVPHRDALLAAPLGQPGMVDAMRERAKDDAARAPHRITSRLFVVAKDGFSEYR